MLRIQLVVFAIVLVLAFNYACGEEFTWASYKKNHKKAYSSTKEESKRKAIWQANYNKIKKHNQEADQNKLSYRLDVNQFTDLSTEEFQKNWLGLKFSNNSRSYEAMQRRRSNRTTTTSNNVVLNGKDWRQKGGVSVVKNQMSCGSCWVIFEHLLFAQKRLKK